MGINEHYIPGAIAIGIGARLIVDLWDLFLKRTFSIPSLLYCLSGRWLRHMPRGTFRHVSITQASPKSLDCAVGWIAHYSSLLSPPRRGRGASVRRGRGSTDARNPGATASVRSGEGLV